MEGLFTPIGAINSTLPSLMLALPHTLGVLAPLPETPTIAVGPPVVPLMYAAQGKEAVAPTLVPRLALIDASLLVQL
jgi:hypothetical protein